MAVYRLWSSLRGVVSQCSSLASVVRQSIPFQVEVKFKLFKVGGIAFKSSRNGGLLRKIVNINRIHDQLLSI